MRIRLAECCLFAAIFMILGFAEHGLRLERHHSRQIKNVLDQVLERRQMLEEDIVYYRSVLRHSIIESSTRLVGRTTDSADVSISLADLQHPLVIFPVDPDCPGCIANVPFINHVHEHGTCDANVIGIAIDRWDLLPEFIATHSIFFPILTEYSGEAISIYPITGPPAIVLIGRRGNLLGWWRGVLTTSMQDEIQSSIMNSC